MKQIQAVINIDDIPLDICPCFLSRKICRIVESGKTFEVAIAHNPDKNKTLYLHKIGDTIGENLCYEFFKKGLIR